MSRRASKEIYTQLPDYGTRKLAHYNEWLLNPKRPSDGVPYPGFPEDVALERARESLKKEYAEKAFANIAKQVTKSVVVAAKRAAVRTSPKKVNNCGTAANPRTKQMFANEVYNERFLLGESRDQIVVEIMERVGMSKAGATTYFYNAKKAAG